MDVDVDEVRDGENIGFMIKLWDVFVEVVAAGDAAAAAAAAHRCP